jgi:FtsH-binding integral membrane protein
MHYNVIFDVTQTGFRHWVGLAVSALFFAFIIGVMWYRKRASSGSQNFTSLFVLLLLCSGFIVALILYSYQNYLGLESAMRQSKCQVTEGIVSDFQTFTVTSVSGGKTKPRSSSGESFVVDGKPFRYREHSVWNGFDELGIIHNGLQVRIYYLQNDIARLEVSP